MKRFNWNFLEKYYFNRRERENKVHFYVDEESLTSHVHVRNNLR